MRSAKLIVAIAMVAAVGAPASPAAAAPPPELPEPTFQSVSHEVLIPMDDGVQLAATIALPSRDGQTPLPGRFPVVLGMTPYSRNGVCSCYPPSFWATRGMVGAVVDVRGTGGSGGTLEGNFFSPREARDSAAVIEYLGTQPYSTGKVGMAGGSYVGITQLLAAEQRPPHLAAIVPQVPIADLYRDGFAHGGIPSLLFDAQYVAVQGAPGAAGANNDPFLLDQTLKAKLGQSAIGTTAFDYLERPNDDPFYRDRSPIYRAGEIEVPTLIIGAWRDGLSARGGPEMYQPLARRRGVETRLYMDPCTHKGCGPPFAPLTDPPGQEDVSGVTFEFLAKHLAGAKTPDRPAVRVLPPAQGRDGRRRPVAAAEHALRAARARAGRAARRRRRSPARRAGDRAVRDQPGGGLQPRLQQVRHGRGDPVRADRPAPRGPQRPHLPHPGARPAARPGRTDRTCTSWPSRRRPTPTGTPSSPTSRRTAASRSSPRARCARLTARSIPPRAHRPGRTTPTSTRQPIEPERFYEYDIEIEPTAYRLARGHRLQLRLTSLDLPTHLPGSIAFDRARPQEARIDLNSVATNTVRFDGSYLVLPAGGPLARALGDGSTRPCLSRRSPIGPRNIGRVRLGYSRRRLLRLPVRAPRRTRRAFRYCVKRSRGRVTAIFSSRSRRARVRMVVTTARGHGNRRVRVGSPASSFRRAYPTRVRVARGLYRVRRGSPRMFGLRARARPLHRGGRPVGRARSCCAATPPACGRGAMTR